MRLSGRSWLSLVKTSRDFAVWPRSPERWLTNENISPIRAAIRRRGLLTAADYRNNQLESIAATCRLNPVRYVHSVRLAHRRGYRARPAVVQRSIGLYANVANGDDYDLERDPERLRGGLLCADVHQPQWHRHPDKYEGRQSDAVCLCYMRVLSLHSYRMFQDRSPAVFSSTYTITPAAVPEPGYALLIPMLLMAVAFRERMIRSTRTRRSR